MSDLIGHPSTGDVSKGFEAVKARFDAFLLSDPYYSAQLSVYWRGEPIVDLVGGPDIGEDTITGVFSCSKGVSGLVIGLLMDRGLLDPDRPVADYWPEFAAGGKEKVTVAELLSHRAGLVGIPGGFTAEEICRSELGAAKLAASTPVWSPGTAFGYHALTMGILMEELLRRITGKTLQEFYDLEIRVPRDVDFFLGLPEEFEPRYRDVLPMRLTPAQQAEAAGRGYEPDSLRAMAFNASGTDLRPNVREYRAAGPSAGCGVGSARGLARVYAAAITEVGGPRLLSPEVVTTMCQQRSWGVDRILNVEMCFGIVFERPQPRMDYGSHLAFGHDGASGALAFADPLYDLGFGYVPQAMQYPGGADARAIELSRTVRACIRDLG